MTIGTRARRAVFGAVIGLTVTVGGLRAAEEAAPAVPAAEAPAAEPADKWVFNSPMYLWFAGMDGTVSAGGRTIDVDFSASDVMQHADLGFQGYFELAKPRYGIYAQPTYMKLSADGEEGVVKGNIESELWIAEVGGFYKFWVWEGKHPGSLAGVAGGRYWSLHNELKLRDPVTTVRAQSSDDLFDPFIGLRYQHYYTEKLHAWVQGDIGGFDISDSQSRFSWQVMPLLGYDFNMIVIHKPSTVFLGYRVLGVQKSDGNESFNLRMQGAVFGLNVQLF